MIFPVSFFHRLTVIVSAHELAAVLLCAASLLTLGFGLCRRRRDYCPEIPLIVGVLAASSLFLPAHMLPLPASIRPWVAGLAGAAWMADGAMRRRREQTGWSDGRGGGMRSALVYLGLLVLVTGLLLFHDLSGFAGSLLVWESPVSREFGDAFLRGEGAGHFLVQRLLWDEGLMSSGQNSLLYGAGTYALFPLCGFTVFTLRLIPVLAALASIVALFFLVRRFHGPMLAAAAASMLSFSTIFLFYARYGTSSSTTVLTVIAAWFTVWLFLSGGRGAWWQGPLCGVALFIATLHYSPGRLVVLVFLGIVVLYQAIAWRRLWWRRALGLALLLAIVSGVWLCERGCNRHSEAFLNARGEQYLNFLKDRFYLKEYLKRDVDPSRLTNRDRLELLWRVVQTTVPQYEWFFTPARTVGTPGSEVLDFDAPRIKLFFAPWVVFVLLGLSYSVFRWRDWRHATLLAWLVLCTPLLLLTNRVDAHRIFLLVLPVTLWAAWGVWDAARAMRFAGVPVVLQHILAGLLLFAALQNAAQQLFSRQATRSAWCERLQKAITSVNRPVLLVVGPGISHMDASWANLAMLERHRLHPDWTGTLCPEEQARQLSDATEARDDAGAQFLERELATRAAILAPAGGFTRLAARLQQRGTVVRSCGGPADGVLVAEAAVRRTE